MRLVVYLTLLLGITVPLFAVEFGSGSQGLIRSSGDILPVERAFVFTYAASSEDIQLDWRIEPGYFLYRHTFRVVAAGRDIELDGLAHGEAKHDEFFGDVEVFYDDVGIGLARSELGGEATIEVHYQGCADIGFCYPPQKIRLNVAKMQASAENHEILDAERPE